MVRDGIFFDPKAYDGTSRGQKNDELVQKSTPFDGECFFRYLGL